MLIFHRFKGRLNFAQSRGTAALEFALVIPVFLFILLTTYDAGRLFFVKAALQNAAVQGARAAAYGETAVNAQAVAVNAANAAGVPGMGKGSHATAPIVSAVATFSSGSSCPSPSIGTVTVTMTASVQFYWLTPLSMVRLFQPASARADSWALSSVSQWVCQ